MQFKKVLPYKLKRAMLISGLAGASLVACNKNNIEPTRDVELKFKYMEADEIEPANIRKHVKDKSVRHIYLVPINGGHFYWTNPVDLMDLCDAIYDRIQIAPEKISGRGDWGFIPGAITPTDSLRFLQMGFTVNQNEYDIPWGGGKAQQKSR